MDFSKYSISLPSWQWRNPADWVGFKFPVGVKEDGSVGVSQTHVLDFYYKERHVFLKQQNQAVLKQTHRQMLPMIYVKKLIWTVHDFEQGITSWVGVYSEEIVLAHSHEVFEWSLGACSGQNNNWQVQTITSKDPVGKDCTKGWQSRPHDPTAQREAKCGVRRMVSYKHCYQ